MRRLDSLLRWLPIATGFALFLALSLRPVFDQDVWWHLRTGAFVVENGLPGNDVLTHTARDHRWVVPDWLCDVLLYETHRAGGPAALTLLMIGAFGASFLILLRIGRLRGASPVATGIALVLAVLVARMRFLERPLMFKFLFSGLWVWGMESYRLHGRRWFWWLVPVAALWENFHSSFVVAPAIPLAYAAALWFERTIMRREGTRSPWPCAAFAVACLAACLVDPRGPSTLVYPFRLGATTVMRNSVMELEPLWHFWDAEPLWIGCLMTFFGVWAISFILQARRAPLCDLAVGLPFLWLGVNSVRFFGLWAFLCAPAVALHLTGVGRAIAARRAWLAGAWRLAAVLPAAAVAALAIHPRGLPISRPALGVNADVLPVHAAEYLDRRQVSGNAFNTFEFGGYLEWACWPRVKTWVDGRGMVFGDAFLGEFLSYYHGGPPWEEAQVRHDTTIAVMVLPGTATAQPLARAFFRILFPQPRWRLVHWDDSAVVYLRDVPANAKAIREDAYEVVEPADLDVSTIPEADLPRLERDLARCLERVPTCARARYLRALLRRRQERLGEAMMDFEEVVRRWPRFAEAHYWLGALFLAEGRGEEAKEHLLRARALQDGFPKIEEILRELEEAGY